MKQQLYFRSSILVIMEESGIQPSGVTLYSVEFEIHGKVQGNLFNHDVQT